jgi:aspartyl-tRNA(Asn)/glutamyl-tRNA(Gln) amidotransferase subunit B
MRSKEEAHDYRYFPDPDLLPLEIEQAWVDEIAGSLPELPDAKKARFMGDYGLSDYDASVLTTDLEAAHYFEDVVAASGDGKLAANWVINELFGRLKKEEHSIDRKPGHPRPARQDHHADQVRRHLRQDRQGPVRDRLHRRRRPGDQIVEARGMKQVTDTGAIEAAVDRDHRRQPRTGGKGETEPQARGLVRGPGDEGHGRQGEPQGGERDRFRQTRALARLAETIRARQRTGLPVRESHRAAAYPEMRESGTR